jgi:hypothetical protein
MIRLSIDDAGIDKAKLFVATIKNQLPFAASQALNSVAFGGSDNVRNSLAKQTTKSFVNPTKYTQSAFRYTRSTKANLEATVFADPTRRFFPTQIQGGDRRAKPYEGFLRGLGNGAIPSSGRLVPTSLVLNAAGNPKKNIFGTIANKLSTTDPGGVFIGTPKGGGREPGVYRRSKGQLYAYFVHVDRVSYQPRFPMERVGMATAKRLFPTELNKALERALNSAR